MGCPNLRVAGRGNLCTRPRWGLLKPRATFPNAPRKIGIVSRRPRSGIDVGLFFELREGKISRGQVPALVKHLVGAPVQQDAPVPLRLSRQRGDVGSAVVAQRVVPLRPVANPVYLFQIVQESSAR